MSKYEMTFRFFSSNEWLAFDFLQILAKTKALVCVCTKSRHSFKAVVDRFRGARAAPGHYEFDGEDMVVTFELVNEDLDTIGKFKTLKYYSITSLDVFGATKNPRRKKSQP